MLVIFLNRLRAKSTDKLLEQANRAAKLHGDRLGLEDFAQFLNLPLTDTLKQVHSLFDQVRSETLLNMCICHFLYYLFKLPLQTIKNEVKLDNFFVKFSGQSTIFKHSDLQIPILADTDFMNKLHCQVF